MIPAPMVVNQAPPLLDEGYAAFIQGGVTCVIGSRNADLRPMLTIGLACRVSPDRRRVTLLLGASQSVALLEDLRANGAIAVVFSQPSTHHSVQLKGTDAQLMPLEPGDLARIDAHSEAEARELALLGEPPSLAPTFFAYSPEDVVAVAFTPTSAFIQTPGPKAGQRLGA